MTQLRYGSVCSGIEAATVAWEPLGFQAAWFAEIEPFPSAVLAHHYPNIPNLGDMTKIAAKVLSMEVEAPEVLVGGTPCQAFSVAGLRESLNDDRGQLSLAFIHLADAIDTVRRVRGTAPAIVVWENVPGVLSTKDNAFGCFLAGLAGEDCELQPPGKKWADAGCVFGPKRTVAWRILDAQYFGLAQRRRRVFVVASAREGFDPCAVLFERDGLRRDSPPSRGQGEGAAVGTLGGTSPGGGWRFGADEAAAGQLIPQAFGGNNQSGSIDVATARNACASASGRMDFETETFVVQTPTMFSIMPQNSGRDYKAREVEVAQPLMAAGPAGGNQGGDYVVQPLAFPANLSGTQCAATVDLSPAMGAKNPTAVAFTQNSRSEVRLIGGDGGVVGALAADAGAQQQNYVAFNPVQEGMGLSDIATPIGASSGGGNQGCVAYTTKLHNTASNNAGKIFEERTACLDANSPPPALLTAMQVRRLMPEECEPLQGFSKGYTLIPWRGKPASECPDGPRYKALGNSMAVPCMHWIGARIQRGLA